MNFSVTDTKPDREPNIPDWLKVRLVIQNCEHMLTVCAELAHNQILLNSNHTELIRQHVIPAEKAHIWPDILKPFRCQQVLRLIQALVVNVRDEVLYGFFRLHGQTPFQKLLRNITTL